MRKIIFIAVLIFVLQATVGLMAHCSSALESDIDTEAQTLKMHHPMQSTDTQASEDQHDCCDEENKSQTQFSDACDCDSGVTHAIVFLESLDINNDSVQYFSTVAIPLAAPKPFLLLRPPIVE